MWMNNYVLLSPQLLRPRAKKLGLGEWLQTEFRISKKKKNMLLNDHFSECFPLLPIMPFCSLWFSGNKIHSGLYLYKPY